MKTIRLFCYFLLAAALMPVKAVAVELAAEDGPVSVRLSVSEHGYGNLTLTYTGMLFRCVETQFGRSSPDIDVVYVLRRPNGDVQSYRGRMGIVCGQWGEIPDERAYHIIAPNYVDDLWEQVVLSRDLPDELSLEVAFVSDRQWDSRFGDNYRLHLRRANDD